MGFRRVVLVAAPPAVALALAWAGIHARRQAEAAAAELARRQLSVETGIDAARLRRADIGRREFALESALAAARVKPATPPPGGMRRPPPKLDRLLAVNPEVRAVYMQAFRANLPLKYLPFFQTLGLSPAQIGRFEDLLIEHEQERLDLQSAAQAQGVAMSDPAMAGLQRQQDAQLRQSETALLGDSGYQQLQRFDRAMPLESAVNDVAALVAQTSPITGPQMTRLLDVLANASGSYQAGGAANVASIDVPAALARAGEFLTPPQLEALRADSEVWQVVNLVKQYHQMQPPK